MNSGLIWNTWLKNKKLSSTSLKQNPVLWFSPNFFLFFRLKSWMKCASKRRVHGLGTKKGPFKNSLRLITKADEDLKTPRRNIIFRIMWPPNSHFMSMKDKPIASSSASMFLSLNFTGNQACLSADFKLREVLDYLVGLNIATKVPQSRTGRLKRVSKVAWEALHSQPWLALRWKGTQKCRKRVEAGKGKGVILPCSL